MADAPGCEKDRFEAQAIAAIEANDLASLRTILAQYLAENPEAFRCGGWGDVLGRALQLSQYDMADELFKRGATWGDGTIADVLEGGREDSDWNTKAIDVALANGWDINEHYAHVGSSLVYTVSVSDGAGDMACLKVAAHLLSKGADPNSGSQMGLNPLELACGVPDKDLAALLLAHGATVQKSCKALLEAAGQGSVEIMQMLLDHDADVNAHPYHKHEPPMFVDDEGWGSALHCAVKNGHVEAVKFLLEKGAETEYRNKVGVTALELARKLGRDEIAPLLESPTYPLQTELGLDAS
ncbi:ankyrin repeat-containing domain protein [Hypoxylon sp. FL1284]|nr:ankyrin repeat-containing domain protein [Hypoxylon sp. FL1284]